jgi:hypothetical protein
MVIELLSVVAFGRLGFRFDGSLYAVWQPRPRTARSAVRAPPTSGTTAKPQCVANAQHGPIDRRVPGRPGPGRGSPSAYMCPRAFNQGTREVYMIVSID